MSKTRKALKYGSLGLVTAMSAAAVTQEMKKDSDDKKRFALAAGAFTGLVWAATLL